MTAANPLVSGTGIGLRQPHYREVFERLPELAFLEVHSENFFLEGGVCLRQARAARYNRLRGLLNLPQHHVRYRTEATTSCSKYGSE